MAHKEVLLASDENRSKSTEDPLVGGDGFEFMGHQVVSSMLGDYKNELTENPIVGKDSLKYKAHKGELSIKSTEEVYMADVDIIEETKERNIYK